MPKSDLVCDIVAGQAEGGDVSAELADAVLSEAIETEVARQTEIGVDIVSDGEFSKPSYTTYVQQRLSGFGGDSPPVTPADLDAFPLAQRMAETRRGAPEAIRRAPCIGPVELKTMQYFEDDVRRMQAAVDSASPNGAFLTAASPGLIAIYHPNRHYPSHIAYLTALGQAMKAEYQAIINAGLDLQIDCPDLAMGRHTAFKNASEAAFLRQAEIQVEALNEALAGLPAERMRIYVSWGNYEGPHSFDVPLAKILPILLKAKPMGIVIEAATPGHQHEWRVFEDIPLPDDKVLLPGVIDVTNNYVEHPEVVADRIERYANLIGRERVIASTDSGFAAFSGDQMVDPRVAAAKLESLVSGARIASRRLGWPA